ncbi:hypothetical protein GJ633_09125 [Halorubrum sp. CBA1125]|uniref:DUF7532 family protein n=1 Tax=Halorubrum sp. CBA1125 TaxID=2668072 RepID=UPI0012E74E2D|nr:hypothetical protein [Halorubrum sp. CBA1125]MUW14807.1 hypothetical protein [Halorubrum sp. CBA1125]
MHFDARTQRALREAGLDADEIVAISDRVADLVAADADRIADFFAADGPFYSDMETAHSTAAVQSHPTADVDLFTHGSELRGYLSLDGWGVPVEGGRVLRTAADDKEDDTAENAASEGATGETGTDPAPPTLVELSLGPTVHDRVRFARDRDEL